MSDHQQLADGSVDPNVVIPKHIREASAAAETIHKLAYEQPQPEHTPEPVAPEAAPEAAPQAVEHQATEPTPEPQPAEDENSQTYKQKFLSMQGRWQASQRRVGELEQSNNDLASELQATQSMLQHPEPQRNHNQAHEKLITEQDREAFGDGLVDFVNRAAREAVSPEIEALRSENAELKKRVVTTGKGEVQAALSRAVPDWQTINTSPEFKQWLSLRNIYTRQVRRELLNSAYQAADAAVVVQVFKDFLTEAKATGNAIPTSQRQQAPAAQAPVAQRQPAMQLESLAAPGRARPAPGDAQVPAEKPIYTHAQIRSNYDLKRRGAFNGREAEWNALEADMIAAAREARVR